MAAFLFGVGGTLAIIGLIMVDQDLLTDPKLKGASSFFRAIRLYGFRVGWNSSIKALQRNRTVRFLMLAATLSFCLAVTVSVVHRNHQIASETKSKAR